VTPIVLKILAVEEDLFALREYSPSRVERRRASILLARGEGLSQRQAAAFFGVARSTVQRTEYLLRDAGLEGLRDLRRAGVLRIARRAEIVAALAPMVKKQPRSYGWLRSTWSIELVCLTIREQLGVDVSVAQMGRLLREARCRRVRPSQSIALAPSDRDEQLERLSLWLSAAPAGDVVLHSDEVDVHLLPKLGPDWAPAGVRKEVSTPGRNKKHYIAGAYDPETKDLVVVDGPSKSSDLFIALLHELARRYEDAGTVHLVVDNYIIHRSKKTKRALKALDGKIRLCFLPPYSPKGNRIERVWLDLHTAITRNHRCADIDELMAEVRQYLAAYDEDGVRAAGHRRAA